MNIQLQSLIVHTRRTTEQIVFSDAVTFLHGPVSTGKSTVARLVDYCLGGQLERTPAIQQEFVTAELSLFLGDYDCRIERSSDDNQSVRITWAGPNGDVGSVNAPLSAQPDPLVDDEVYNLSDLVFYLCGITPIKVRQRSRDPDSPLIRLSFRDIWSYCYLDQTHLDSSFFRLEDPFRGRKSQDAMKFFTGLHSEQLSQLETDLMRTVDQQRSMRKAVEQIRLFMDRFEFGSELDMVDLLRKAEQELSLAEERRSELERTRSAETHPTDRLRNTLRSFGREIEVIRQAIAESKESVDQQKALRAELITAKIKADRSKQAGVILGGVQYQRCPECGTDMSGRPNEAGTCRLCGIVHTSAVISGAMSPELEAVRRDLNDRIDQIGDSISRRERELARMKKRLEQAEQQKSWLDRQLQDELARYDSAFVESIRDVEREIATLTERITFLGRLRQMPEAINKLEQDAGELQGRIDGLRVSINERRQRLSAADANISAIADEFKRIMLLVSFPGVSEEDRVIIEPRNWRPAVLHGNQEWSFWDAGSGGKKTLFNVCYALAIHAVALKRQMPVPTLLIIDSPTKNISEDENPELVRSLYAEIYRLAREQQGIKLQFLLVDSDLVAPDADLPHFIERRMAGEQGSTSLIPYYVGP